MYLTKNLYYNVALCYVMYDWNTYVELASLFYNRVRVYIVSLVGHFST